MVKYMVMDESCRKPFQTAELIVLSGDTLLNFALDERARASVCGNTSFLSGSHCAGSHLSIVRFRPTSHKRPLSYYGFISGTKWPNIKWVSLVLLHIQSLYNQVLDVSSLPPERRMTAR